MWAIAVQSLWDTKASKTLKEWRAAENCSITCKEHSPNLHLCSLVLVCTDSALTAFFWESSESWQRANFQEQVSESPSVWSQVLTQTLWLYRRERGGESSSGSRAAQMSNIAFLFISPGCMRCRFDHNVHHKYDCIIFSPKVKLSWVFNLWLTIFINSHHILKTVKTLLCSVKNMDFNLVH